MFTKMAGPQKLNPDIPPYMHRRRKMFWLGGGLTFFLKQQKCDFLEEQCLHAIRSTILQWSSLCKQWVKLGGGRVAPSPPRFLRLWHVSVLQGVHQPAWLLVASPSPVKCPHALAAVSVTRLATAPEIAVMTLSSSAPRPHQVCESLILGNYKSPLSCAMELHVHEINGGRWGRGSTKLKFLICIVSNNSWVSVVVKLAPPRWTILCPCRPELFVCFLNQSIYYSNCTCKIMTITS